MFFLEAPVNSRKARVAVGEAGGRPKQPYSTPDTWIAGIDYDFLRGFFFTDRIGSRGSDRDRVTRPRPVRF